LTERIDFGESLTEIEEEEATPNANRGAIAQSLVQRQAARLAGLLTFSARSVIAQGKIAGLSPNASRVEIVGESGSAYPLSWRRLPGSSRVSYAAEEGLYSDQR
jgi:hypothetical protein